MSQKRTVKKRKTCSSPLRAANKASCFVVHTMGAHEDQFGCESECHREVLPTSTLYEKKKKSDSVETNQKRKMNHSKLCRGRLFSS